MIRALKTGGMLPETFPTPPENLPNPSQKLHLQPKGVYL